MVKTEINNIEIDKALFPTRLTPTIEAFQDVRRALQEPPHLDPTQYGWSRDEETKSLQPPPTKLPALDYVLKLVSCSCASRSAIFMHFDFLLRLVGGEIRDGVVTQLRWPRSAFRDRSRDRSRGWDQRRDREAEKGNIRWPRRVTSWPSELGRKPLRSRLRPVGAQNKMLPFLASHLQSQLRSRNALLGRRS